MTTYADPGKWTEAKLIAGSQTTPVPASLKHNAALLVNFMNKIPFRVGINSGYRSGGINEQIGGSGSSQHPNALAVDIRPPSGMSNTVLAHWFWGMRPFFPEIDQVITYTRKGHLHVGICPAGATGCVAGAPRGEFLVNDAGTYVPFIPAASILTNDIMGISPLNPKRWLYAVGISAALSVVVLAAAWRFRDPLKARLGL